MTARSVRGTFILLAVLATVALATNGAISAQPMVGRQDPPLARGDADTVLRTSSVMFIENAGQWPDAARFQVWGGTEGTVWLAEEAIWITVAERAEGAGALGNNEPDHEPTASDLRPVGEQLTRTIRVKLSFVEANRHPRIEPFDGLDTAVSYFIGDDPAAWRPAVPVWAGVRYVELYPGVDLEVTSDGGRLAPRLIARSGADPSAVRLRVEGADWVSADAGVLRLRTDAGEATFPLLQVDRVPAGAVTVQRRDGLAFDVGEPFVHAGSPQSSDPGSPADNPSDLLYGTYLGGSKDDEPCGIAVDGAGNAYVAGQTLSADFPTTVGAFRPIFGGGGYAVDLFVAKLDGAGRELLYATFLGGSTNGDYCGGVAADSSGHAYVTGHTYSADFPTTPGAFDTSSSGYDGILAKLNPTGSNLVFSTFIGGSHSDEGNAVAVDATGSAYVTGYTTSRDFPTTSDAVDGIFNGVDGEAFVVKFNPQGSGLRYATYLGGYNDDEGRSVALDGTGCAYVTGMTESSDFPKTPGAYSTRFYNQDENAFVVKLDPTGNSLGYGTSLGCYNCTGEAVAVDASGSAHVTGIARNEAFPTTPGAYDRTFNGYWDAYVVKLNAAGSGLVYSTYLGGRERDYGQGIAVDSAGNAYVTGETDSAAFPTTAGAFDSSFGSGGADAFLAQFSGAGSELAYATYLGGSRMEAGHDVEVDAGGRVHVTGSTTSPDFPTTPGNIGLTNSGGWDAFVVKMAMGGGANSSIVSGIVTDGHSNALNGAFVGLLMAGQPNYVMTTTTAAGAYAFSGALEPGSYQVRVILRDADGLARIQYGDHGVLVAVESTPLIIPTSGRMTVNIDFADPSLVSDVPVEHRADLAVMFRHTQEVSYFVREVLGESDFVPVDFVWGYSPLESGVYYCPTQDGAVCPAGRMVSIDKYYSYSAISYSAISLRPQGREWHENLHHVMNDLLGWPAYHTNDKNHDGYANHCTVDAWVEGWAEFWPCAMADSLDYPGSPEVFAWPGGPDSLEFNWWPWDERSGLSMEEFAVASLLWDLYDAKASWEHDAIDLSLATLWSVLRTATPDRVGDMRDLYLLLLSQASLINEDGSIVKPADIQEIFIAHGFYADNGNHFWESGEEIGWGGRKDRRSLPAVPNAFLRVNVKNESGDPVDSAMCEVKIRYQESRYDFAYKADCSKASGNLIALGLPPTRAPASAQIAVNRLGASSEAYSIDNSTYWEAVRTATDGYAVEHTFVVPDLHVYLPLVIR